MEEQLWELVYIMILINNIEEAVNVLLEQKPLVIFQNHILNQLTI